MRKGLSIALVLTALIGWAQPAAAQADDVLVFAAASLKNALDEAIASFGQRGDAKVTASYASSSALAKQIEQGAPAQIFFSADLDWMDYLDGKGLIAADTRANLLRNRIVLVAPDDSRVGEVAVGRGLDLGGLVGDGRLAVANVEAVPAGKYAKASLEALGAWQGVAGKLAQAENVRAALALVAQGEAPLGIVYATDAIAESGVKVVGTFPADSHPPIVYPVALTEEADGEAAARFLAFLKSPAARSAFGGQGFTFIEQPSS